MPALTVVPPVYVLWLVRVAVPLPVFVKELLPEITPESVSDVLTTLIDTLLPRAIPTEIDEEVTPESTVIRPLANVRLFPLTEKLFAANSIDWKVVPAVKLSCVAVRVVPENTRASPDTVRRSTSWLPCSSLHRCHPLSKCVQSQTKVPWPPRARLPSGWTSTV